MPLAILIVLSFSKVLWKIVFRSLLTFIVAVMLNTRFQFMMLKVVNLLFIFSLKIMTDLSFEERLEAAKAAGREAMKDIPKLRYFKPIEFEKCIPPCKIDDMDKEFLVKLDDARSLCSYAFVLNSAFRSPEYEREKGRSGTSSHTKGLAVDISCLTSICRLKIIMALLAVGFRRIGVYPTFIHVDSDISKPASLWYGKS